MHGRLISRLLRFKLVALTLMAPKAALACSVCFGGPSNDPHNKALRAGVLFLLAVVFVVLGIFARFFWSIRNRTRHLLSK